MRSDPHLKLTATSLLPVLGSLVQHGPQGTTADVLRRSCANRMKLGPRTACAQYARCLEPKLATSTMTDLRNSLRLSEVEHSQHLAEYIGSLSLSSEYSDVTFVVGEERIPAHRLILSCSCEYFRALLNGGSRDSPQKEIVLPRVPSEAFRLLLGYIYTGRLSLGDLEEDTVLDLLELAHQCGLKSLLKELCRYLKVILSVRNVCTIYDKAQSFGLERLRRTCCRFMDRHASVILQSEAFVQLSADAFRGILLRDSFCAQEIEIFDAVKRWCTARPDYKDFSSILEAVRLPLIAYRDLLSTVRSSDLIPADQLLDAIQRKTECRDVDLNHRGKVILEENIATVNHGARVLTGEPRCDLLEPERLDFESGFAKHIINDETGITIELGEPYVINHLVLRLWDKDLRAYSYYVEVSMDLEDWHPVIDYSNCLCRSSQKLYFEPRVVCYIRVVGTHSSVNKQFHLVSFEAMFTAKPFKVSHGICVPEENVALWGKKALVTEGASRNRHSLINGNFTTYDWDSGYTCHQVGAGSIIVRLPQPYLIDSMRMLLWDRDSRTYSYYIETSVDDKEWTRVVDRTSEDCRSWQILTFQPLAVVFIKIVGTASTANGVFHCVHFECPAQVLSLEECTVSSEADCPSATPIIAP